MMWRHAESLMAGAVALYLNFNTKSMHVLQPAVEWPLWKWWRALMSGGWISRAATLIQEVNFLMDLRTYTNNLRLLMRCDSCSLSGFLALIIRDVFILELLTCVWKCEFPQVPVCSKWHLRATCPHMKNVHLKWDGIRKGFITTQNVASPWLRLSRILTNTWRENCWNENHHV